MQTLIQVLAKKKKQWFELNYTDLTMGVLLNEYSSVYVKFFVPEDGLVKQFNLRLMDGHNTVPNDTQINDFITNYEGFMAGGYRTDEWLQLTNKKRAVYKSVWEYGLNAELVNNRVGVLQSNQSYVPDIKLTATRNQITPLSEIESNCLFTVNGVVVAGEVVNDAIILRNGTKLLERSREKNISVIDFSNVGSYTKRNVADLNVTLFNTLVEEGRTKAFVYKIQAPVGTSVKDTLLVINGQLHIFNNYNTLDVGFITVTIPVELMLTQLVDIPASQVNWIGAANTTDDGYDISSIDPLAYIGNNSWALTFDTAELCVDIQPLLRTGFINTYTFYENPVGVLYHRDGTMGEYQVTWSTSKGVEINTSRCRVTDDLRSLSNSTTGTNNSCTSFISKTTDAILKTLYTL